MLLLRYRLMLLSWLLGSLALGQPSLDGAGSAETYAFQIEAASCLYIEGSSNVTDFRCDCETAFPAGRVQVNADGTHLDFSGARLNLPTRSIDCGHRGINRDMYETLEAESHPTIRIELLNAHLPTNTTALGGQGETVWASIRITLAGQSQTVRMRAHAQRLSAQRYRFVGRHDIYLTHFGLTPPSPMLGLIKVADRLEISLDLVVWVE